MSNVKNIQGVTVILAVARVCSPYKWESFKATVMFCMFLLKLSHKLIFISV
jgi:hypothetical protein